MSKIEDAVGSVRSAIDENWSQRRRLVVAVGASVVAVLVLAGGLMLMRAGTPPKLPQTVDQAVAVINSSRYRNLDGDRKRQYAEAASELMRDLPEDQRHELFRDEDARRAMRTAFMERMDDMARRLARGESLQELMGDMPFGPRGRRPGGGPGGRARGPDANRDGDREGGPDGGGPNRAERFAGRIGGMVQSGNAQRNALRMEMMQRMRAERESQGGPG